MPNATRELEGDLSEWLRMARELFDDDERYPFGIFLKDGTFVGSCTVTCPEESPDDTVFGYWTHARHLRRGYMTEAVGALVELFSPAKFVIHCNPNNAASAGVAKKLGFTHVGFSKQDEMRWELVVTAD